MFLAKVRGRHMVGHIREVLHNVKRKQLQSGACHRSNIFRFDEDSVGLLHCEKLAEVVLLYVFVF